MSKRHFFLIDPMEKLNTKKDTSLFLALTAKKMGHESYLIFDKNFYAHNFSDKYEILAHSFEGEIGPDFYLKNFKLGQEKSVEIKKTDTIHMRIDPPVDSRYLSYLWALQLIQKKGMKITNDPTGILKVNEKVDAYLRDESYPSWIGKSVTSLEHVIEEWKKSYTALVVKPINGFSGIGVKKITFADKNFKSILDEVFSFSQDMFIAQPYLSQVEKGEKRVIYFRGELLGAILKMPKDGGFISNIAQGAKFQKVDVSPLEASRCLEVSQSMLKDGIELIAFDVLGEVITEINVTCPGLLVELSSAHQKNLAEKIF